MTTSRHLSAPMRAPRHRSTTDRVISAGLAAAACAGLVGVIGVRSIEHSAAVPSDAAVDPSSTGADAPALSSAGLSEAQLDAYAAQLQTEGAKLDAYRAKLQRLAKHLTAATPRSTTTAGASVRAPSIAPVRKPKPVLKPVAKPAPKPAAAPAPKKHSTTKSS